MGVFLNAARWQALSGSLVPTRERGNEDKVLAKMICNNLCCVILSQCELGIEAEFWQDELAIKGADVLPLVRPG